MPTPPATTDELLELVGKSGLLEPAGLEGYVRRRWAAGGLPATPQDLADALVRDGLLTEFQAEQLLRGRWRQFILAGKYKILRPLGAGAMGHVFLCEHVVMRRRVALKLLPAGRAEDPAAVQRFHREARAVARLSHPNVVGAHDVDHDGKLHFLVMEYVEGVDLARLVSERGPLPVAVACDYARQAALGLQHAHEHGLVHRDVKPSNLLVDRAGAVKVLDMGLARFFHDEGDDLSRRHGNSPLGTWDYMAPEQALDSHSADIRADVYGLGGTLYFLLAGHPPFPEGGGPHKMLWMQTREPRPIREVRPEVPEGLAATLARMMAKDLARRYQTPGAVAEALAPWSRSPAPPPGRWLPEGGSDSGVVSGAGPAEGTACPTSETAAPPPSTGGPAASPPRAREGAAPAWAGGLRRRWAFAALGAVLLAGVGLAGFALHRWGGPRGSEGEPGAGPGPVPASPPRLRLLVPAYFYPGGEGEAEWDRLLATPDPALVVIIANPASGPGKKADPKFVRVIERARGNGFTVIGYVSTGYAERSLAQVKDDVNAWVRYYPDVQGIFFDEQRSAADRVDYYAALYRHAREHGLGLVINNPGTKCAEDYLKRPAADVVCVAESAKDFREFRPPSWAGGYPAGRFAALICGTGDPARMREYVLGMADKRVGYGYVTDGAGDNPWGRLPRYWDEEVEAVRRVNAAPAGERRGSSPP
jgi:serine/threonine protein kinase